MQASLGCKVLVACCATAVLPAMQQPAHCPEVLGGWWAAELQLFVLLLCRRLGLEWVSCGDELDRVRRALTAGLFTNAVRYESTSYDRLNMGDAGSNAYTLLRSSGKGGPPALLLLSIPGHCSRSINHQQCLLCRPCSTAQVGHAQHCCCLHTASGVMGLRISRLLAQWLRISVLCRCQAAHRPSVGAGAHKAAVVAVLPGAAVPVRVV